MAQGLALLLEDGTALLLEDGTALLLEAIAVPTDASVGFGASGRGVQGHAGVAHAGVAFGGSAAGVQGHAGVAHAGAGFGGSFVGTKATTGRVTSYLAFGGSEVGAAVDIDNRNAVIEVLYAGPVVYMVGTRSTAAVLTAVVGFGSSFVGAADVTATVDAPVGFAGSVLAVKATAGRATGELAPTAQIAGAKHVSGTFVAHAGFTSSILAGGVHTTGTFVARTGLAASVAGIKQAVTVVDATVGFVASLHGVGHVEPDRGSSVQNYIGYGSSFVGTKGVTVGVDAAVGLVPSVLATAARTGIVSAPVGFTGTQLGTRATTGIVDALIGAGASLFSGKTATSSGFDAHVGFGASVAQIIRRGSIDIDLSETGDIDFDIVDSATILLTLEDLMDIVGVRKRVGIEVWDETVTPRALTDPSSMTVTVQHADDPIVLYDILDLAHDATGRYHLDVDCPDPGGYTVRAESTGSVVAVDEAFWRVRASAIAYA